jgi:small-conductance mechanosensitive channel
MFADDVTSLIVAGGCAVAGMLIGLGARAFFGVMVRRAAATPRTWDDVGWGLLRGIALPAGTTFGLWWAGQALRLPEPIRQAVDRALLAVVLLVVVFSAARLAAGLVRSIVLSRSGVAQSASIFVNVTRAVVLGIGVLVLLQTLGISVTPLLTALGVGGLAVALALQDTLGNLFAGVQILASKKVQPGDFIRLDSGEEGHVVDINWRNTTIREAGNIVTVPNAKLADAIVTNFHQPRRDMSVPVEVGVSYDSDLEEVEKVTLEVARDVLATVEGAVPAHQPSVRFRAFGDNGIDFVVILRAAEYNARYLIVHEFIKRLHTRYRAEGIEIPCPAG